MEYDIQDSSELRLVTAEALDKITEFKTDRKFAFLTGKKGVIEMEKALWKRLKFSPEKIKELEQRLDEELDDARYYYNGLGFEKCS